MTNPSLKPHRLDRLPLAVACALVAAQVSAAPLGMRLPGAAPPAVTAVPAAGPQRPAPPARMQAPYKPVNLGSAGISLQGATVHWTVPDQSDGRVIQQWVVRACPRVQGSPYAACQPVPGPAAGQPSGAMVQAQVPAHVEYMGASTPVNGVEICAANSAGTSCADRLALSIPNPGIAPVPLRGVAPVQSMGMGGPGGVAPRAKVALNPQPLPPGAVPLGGSPQAPERFGIAVHPGAPSAPPSGGIRVANMPAPPTPSGPRSPLGGALQAPPQVGIAVHPAPLGGLGRQGIRAAGIAAPATHGGPQGPLHAESASAPSSPITVAAAYPLKLIFPGYGPFGMETSTLRMVFGQAGGDRPSVQRTPLPVVSAATPPHSIEATQSLKLIFPPSGPLTIQVPGLRLVFRPL